MAPLLAPGSPSELPPDFVDLAFLHRLVSVRRPERVLEFGVGHSTLVLAHALSKSHRRKGVADPRLYVVDSSEEWIENVRRKVPSELATCIEFRHARAGVAQLDGKLCHLFEELPNIRPRLIYVDGPDPAAVEGDVHGLRFTTEDGQRRPPVGADVLLYESTLRRGACVVIDGRNQNAAFLRRYLARKWDFQTNVTEQRHVFTLVE